jgi:hypothetical protein
MFDGRGMVDEPYKDGSGSEHGIYQTYKLALYLYALQKISGTYSYGEEESLFRSQGPDGGFHTGYDQIGTYAGTQENAETTSIVMITISTSSCILPFCSIPPWIIYLYTGLAVAAVLIVVTILVLERRKHRSAIPSVPKPTFSSRKSPFVLFQHPCVFHRIISCVETGFRSWQAS